MNILVLGSGGREHALAWQCAKDNKVDIVYVATGNAGTAIDHKLKNVDINISNHSDVIKFCQNNHIEFVIVGPEVPLVAGIVDDCQKAGIKVWGPTAYCAQLEGSKTFAKEFMLANNIPTAKYRGFTDANKAKSYVNEEGTPIVIKADGLAAGKGVVIAETIKQAHEVIDDMLANNKFGNAGSRVVIEQFLTGEEASFICMIDGDNILPMATSQDHKRIGEGDTGPNTGGMGAYSPAPVVTIDIHNKVMERVIQPVVSAMKASGNPYTGFLYAGLMIDDNNDPYVIEFNCRFGDPETQPIMMRLQSSLVDLIDAGLKNQLPSTANWDERPCLGIVLASKGYPVNSSKGDIITGLENFSKLEARNKNVKLFHAGTKQDNNNIVTAGGRVLCVTTLANSISEAQALALDIIEYITFDGMHYRTDIGHRAINREKPNF